MKLLPVLLLLAFLILPSGAVEAQQSILDANFCSGTDCSACDLVLLANNLIKWLIGTVMVLFSVLAVWAGFGLVTSGGNPSALSDAKSKFTNAFIGLLIVLSAWLVVDTLMRGLVGNGGEIEGYGPWSQVYCARQADATVVANIISEDTALISAGLASTGVATGTVPVAANCGFDESSLVSIPGEGGHRAVASVASRYVNMRNAASAQGINLSLTSSHRSDARQTQLWDQCPECQARGSVARPCSRGGGGSRHSSGVALDISSSAGRAGRCDVVRLCRSAGASFIMLYGSDSNHVHCDWGGRSGEVNVSC